MPKLSIIIRTYNEEAWIGQCLSMVYRQDFKDFEVVLVDNQSTDQTLRVAKQYPLQQVTSITDFLPGRALNRGIEAACGEWIVSLSAHCIPQSTNWLKKLISGFEDERVAGIYGRQLPLTYSSPADKRDLWMTFGLDRRVQVKDYFFHNANSAFRRSVWEQIPFDANVKHVEDRIWAKSVIESGSLLVYEPEAAVYHHHGIHQNADPGRARGVVSVLENIDAETAHQELPEPLLPENTHVTAIVPVLSEAKSIHGRNLLAMLLAEMKTCPFIRSIYILTDTPSVKRIAREHAAQVLDRPKELASPDAGLVEVLQYALAKIEGQNRFPERILYANYLYPFRPARLFETLVEDAQYNGLDTVFAGYQDYQNTWVKDKQGNFTEIGELHSRAKKEPIYKAIYGLGCLSSAATIRLGKLTGERMGIIPVSDPKFILKCADAHSEDLVQHLFQEEMSVSALGSYTQRGLKHD